MELKSLDRLPPELLSLLELLELAGAPTKIATATTAPVNAVMDLGQISSDIREDWAMRW